MSEERTGDGGGAGAPMAPFDLWTQWLRSTLGEVTATPGASVPWLASPGVSTGEEAEPLPEGAIRQDPLLSTVEKLWDANPLQNVLPINWLEITRSLQTLWAREMSDPARAAQRATEYNDGDLERRGGPLLGSAPAGEGRGGQAG
jgi:polyhydroxyalkanoate synthase